MKGAAGNLASTVGSAVLTESILEGGGSPVRRLGIGKALLLMMKVLWKSLRGMRVFEFSDYRLMGNGI